MAPMAIITDRLMTNPPFARELQIAIGVSYNTATLSVSYILPDNPGVESDTDRLPEPASSAGPGEYDIPVGPKVIYLEDVEHLPV